ncbi:MAG: N-acetylneuraminate synthase [Lachnospiraceae bacterium]|jgi:N-acetylneuraminate synthase|nr:MAG: N-acetylneuraminate synthase [Lachnospiraceae bacterium]
MSKVFIIAEAGVNHNGNLNIAKKMVDVACEAGADAIKFQTFKTENLVCINAEKADYQKKTTDKNESQAEMLKKLELTREEHYELLQYCRQKKIMFLSTPFDEESIDLLVQLRVPIIKIPSGEITNYPYLKKIGGLKNRVILSTGMSTLEEVADAIKVLKDNGTEDITLLHCNSQYPTPMEDVNLKAINTLKETFNLKVGYSDHTLGIEVPIAATAMGASVIEKHFTIDSKMEGPDHKASLEPDQLKEMVKAIRNIEKALGCSEKKVSPSEEKNLKTVRKSIVASKTIYKGEKFNVNNITTKRPGIGISPMEWENVLGKIADRDYEVDEMIQI